MNNAQSSSSSNSGRSQNRANGTSSPPPQRSRSSSRDSSVGSKPDPPERRRPPPSVTRAKSTPPSFQADYSETAPLTPAERVAARNAPSSSSTPALLSNRSITSSVHSQHSGIDFVQDPVSEMTWSRKIALFCMKRYAWYNPRLKAQNNPEVDETSPEHEETSPSEELRIVRRKDGFMQQYPFTVSKRESPSLEKAWAYWEHVSLPRFVVEPKEGPPKNCLVRAYRKLCCKGNKQLQRAEPGERNLPTKLYSPIFTPHKQLGDFGIGIGLYFSTLRALTILTLVAGFLNWPNFHYYSSDAYSSGQPNVTSFALKGSAICTDTVWVPCPNCNPTNFLKDKNRFRSIVLGSNETGANETVLNFALKNDCDGATLEQGIVNFATLILVLIGIVMLNFYLRYIKVVFDEDEQTAQDYSINVQNPPPDATDPEEWKRFFYDNFYGAHTTAITIAVDNDLLVRSLVERRELLRKIETMIEPGTSMDTLTLARLAAKEERERQALGIVKALIIPGIPELFGRVVVLTAKVQGLAQQAYPATNVLVTFETEAAQRLVLQKTSVAPWDIRRKNTKAVSDPKYLFRGQHLLHVVEPDEPNTIRWQDLNEKLTDRLKQQALTTLCTVAAIAVIALIVRWLSNTSVTAAAFGISIFNTLFPMFAKILTGFESHASESGKQRSLYWKIALFRWVNTAVVITIITPFTSTLDARSGLISQIYALFFADILTTNAIQLADPMGHIQRHFLAPRATTQDAMNLNMQGQVFELAERYTNMTKIFFLALWYCAIFPATFFLCSLALFINYFTDRISLMRTWKRPPNLGPDISEFSRRYFFSLAIMAMALLSSYYWAGFPFDNLCLDHNNTLPPVYVGNWTLGSGANYSFVQVVPDETAYQFCSQDFFRFHNDINEKSFPFIKQNQRPGQEWMTEDQETVTTIYGWSAVGVMGVVVASFVFSILSGVIGYFRASYSPCGDDQGINFSDVPSISTYIPQVQSTMFSYPLLACNIDNIDTELLEWTDPDRPFAFYDLTKDAEVLLRGLDVSSKAVFSTVAHYPPPSKQ